MAFFTGYVLEKSLAVDNLFVFLMIFSYFKVPPQYQHRVLLYGVFGAIVLRALMVFIGAVLVREFSWVLYIFGAFLLYTGLKMLKHGENNEQEDLSQNKMLIWLQKHIRVSHKLNGEKFFTIENGKRVATPLLLVLIMVELSDIVFAVDSIPAIFAITTDPFIVLTSNIFAILGLRAMYFLLAGIADRFVFLHYGLAFVLSFIGIKMLIAKWTHIPVGISLAVVFGALGHIYFDFLIAQQAATTKLTSLPKHRQKHYRRPNNACLKLFSDRHCLKPRCKTASKFYLSSHIFLPLEYFYTILSATD
ncbi:transmembrane transport protein [Neisseria canis]|uniref:Transmembrane transport protein n=1 Tax=Neisseria canis TaxID=493 RepID=A0A3S4P455_9NEIS|nr:transmembrane transport protein [Neisseria canis]